MRCPENKTKKHKLAHDIVSESHRCAKCGKPIKQRLVQQKESTPKLCYRHWLESKGKLKNQRRE